MGEIKVLDDLTIQKIAAGEVVERPSSIVKELVENSVDANSKNITVEIKDGGKSYIRITDDGDGITENDLKLAFKPHSTSKLKSVEDLYEITSLGFRGEALASVSNVSKVEVMTKTEDAMAGAQALIEEGQVLSTNIVGCPKGTTMIVKDLFYNLPVRKQFLKSDIIESNKISDIVYKIALGNSDISFKFIRDNKIVLTTSSNNNLESHIYSVLGKDFSKNLVEVNGEDNGFKVTGYISNNQLYRSNRSHQYIYINGRYIDNPSISKIVESNYRTILPLKRFPVFILFIEIDPKSIDVNIHPTKQEIKFANHNEIIEIINSVVKDALQSSMIIPKVNFRKESVKKDKKSLPLLFDLKKDDKENENKENNIENLNEEKTKENIIEKDIIIKDLTKNKNNEENINKDSRMYINEDKGEENYKSITEIYNDAEIYKKEINVKSEKTIENILLDLEPIGVVFNNYILAEDKLNEKIYFIDQHAAHERVMYERYLREYEKENIVIQQLLAPEIIELTNVEMTTFTGNINVFIKLGFEVEEFGGNSIAIRGVPLLFGIPNIKDLFYDLLDNIDSNIKSSYDFKLEKIMKIACVNSVKSGDNIEKIEMLSLFEQLKLCKKPYTCPHGRPTLLEISKKDIEKEFLRIT